MTDQLYAARGPRFNHVAMSVPSSLLDDTNRADIDRFWGEVFGFHEIPQMTDPGRRLVLSAGHVEQFVFLISDDEPMRCPRLDHYGISVGSLDDLNAAYERAVAFRQHDERVDLIEPHVDDHEVVKIHAFYAGYLLPMMLEVQYWEYAS
jgi:hypothetical protein